MFDTTRDTPSISTSGNINIVIKVIGKANSLALLKMTNVTSVTVSSTIGGITAYPSTIHNITNGSLIITDLPTSIASTVTISIAGTGTIKCGYCVVGDSTYIGNIQRNTNVDTINYSSVYRDEYGNASITVRRSVPKITTTLFAETKHTANILKIRKTYAATPLVWCGLESQTTSNFYDSLIILGFYRVFSLSLDSSLNVSVTLELEEI